VPQPRLRVISGGGESTIRAWPDVDEKQEQSWVICCLLVVSGDCGNKLSPGGREEGVGDGIRAACFDTA
jgi:hypothetical protein